MSADFRKLSDAIWDVADLLRGRLSSEHIELNEALVSDYLGNEQKRKVIDSWISRAVYTWNEQQRKVG